MRLLWWTVCFGWLALTFLLSSLPGNRIGPSPFFEADKLAHSALFAIGSYPLFMALRRTVAWSSRNVALGVWILMLMAGALDEVHQLYTPGRSGGDLGDLIADAVGALVGTALAWVWYERFRAKTTFPAPLPNRAA